MRILPGIILILSVVLISCGKSKEEKREQEIKDKEVDISELNSISASLAGEGIQLYLDLLRKSEKNIRDSKDLEWLKKIKSRLDIFAQKADSLLDYVNNNPVIFADSYKAELMSKRAKELSSLVADRMYSVQAIAEANQREADQKRKKKVQEAAARYEYFSNHASVSDLIAELEKSGVKFAVKYTTEGVQSVGIDISKMLTSLGVNESISKLETFSRAAEQADPRYDKLSQLQEVKLQNVQELLERLALPQNQNLFKASALYEEYRVQEDLIKDAVSKSDKQKALEAFSKVTDLLEKLESLHSEHKQKYTENAETIKQILETTSLGKTNLFNLLQLNGMTEDISSDIQQLEQEEAVEEAS